MDAYNDRKPIKKKASSKKQKKFVRFMFLTGLGGIGVFAVVFILIFSMFLKGGPKAPNKKADENKSTSVTQAAVEEGKSVKIIGIVTEGSIDDEISIYDTDNDKDVKLKIEGTTELKDKYGQAMTLAEFKAGDIIQAKYDTATNNTEYMKLSAEAWELKEVQNMKIDTNLKSIQIGNNVYSYTDKIISMYKDKPFDISNAAPVDIFTVRGYKDKVWSVILEQSHGYISVKNFENSKDAVIEIDTNISMLVKDALNVPVVEGIHKVVVNKENSEPFVKQVMVNEGETVEIDLGDVQAKVSTLEINVNESDYKLIIDGTPQAVDVKPLTLKYGNHKITVKKEGYIEWNKDLKANQPYIKLNVELKKELELSDLHIETNPSGAEVYVDDTYIGDSPIQMQSEYGKHQVIIKKTGYTSINMSILVNSKRKDFIFNLQEDKPKEEQTSNNQNTESTTKGQIETPANDVYGQ